MPQTGFIAAMPQMCDCEHEQSDEIIISENPNLRLLAYVIFGCILLSI
jgi:hypothetical protein